MKLGRIAAAWLLLCGQAMAVPAPSAPPVVIGTTTSTVARGDVDPLARSAVQPGAAADTLTVLGRTEAARAGDRINVRDFGALGDTQSSNTVASTIAAGSTSLAVAGGVFTGADCATPVAGCTGTVSKRINVDGAGPLRSLGFLQSIPVTAPGAYTTRPVISLSGSAAGVVPLPLMAVQTAVVASGGAGFPASTSVTLTMPPGSGGTAAQVTGTTNASGVLAGTLTISVAGSYQQGTATDTLLGTATQTPTAATSTPTTYPTITLTWGVGGVQVAGQGYGLPLSGVTASITGSATLGTPVIGQTATPLSAKILAVNSPTSLTLDTAATTAISASTAGLTWGHDDTAAIAAAKTWADARYATTGVYPVLYAPAGTYLVSAPIATWYHLPGDIVGDGINRTAFKLDALMTGPLFSWSDDWFGGSGFPAAGPTVGQAGAYLQPTARDFAVIGDLTVAAEQDALVLYDRNDRVQFDRVMGSYLWGRMAYAGGPLNVPSQAYMRESYWTDVYCDHCGAPGVPVFEVSTTNTAGTGDSTNTNEFTNLMAWDVGGPGLVVRNNAPATAKATTFNNFIGGRLEGGVSGVSADLITIGDSTMTGSVAQLNLMGMRAIAGAPGSAALKLAAPALASQPNGISAQGLIVSAAQGRGVVAGAGRNVRLDVASMSSLDTGVTVGASTLVSQPVVVDGRGLERQWTWSVDPTSYNAVMEPIYRTGDPTGGNGAIVGNMHDGSSAGGIAYALGCVDLQITRTSPGQVCAATYAAILSGRLNSMGGAAAGSVIAGGSGNYTNAPFSAVTNGLNNSLTAPSTTSPSRVGGSGVIDRGRSGYDGYGAGNISVIGDNQGGRQYLRGTGATATAIRLTSDLLAASASNTGNLTAGMHYHTRVSVSCRDLTAAGWAAWDALPGDLDRPTAGASTYAGGYVSSTAPTRSSGTLTGMTLLIAADATNQGINVAVTPASGNTDTIHCGSLLETTEEIQ